MTKYRKEYIYEKTGGPKKVRKGRRLKEIRLVKVETNERLIEYEWYKDFARECRHVRLSIGLSQSQLGHQIGSTQAVISRFEAGKFAPTVEFLNRLATALNKKIEIRLR